MHRNVFRALAFSLLALAGNLAPCRPAEAQGFSSVSNLPAAAAPSVKPTTPGTAAPTSHATETAGTSQNSAPIAQVASVGSAAAPGAAPTLASIAPGGSGKYYGGSNTPFEPADKVLVVKHERMLYLMHGERTVGTYPVKLGLNPYGHKQQEGDFRTPEGKYELTRRNPRSEFFLAIQLSYPNREDEAVARENRTRPGGLIMIHGQPNVPRRPAEFYATRDWTDGCIALSNADMVDVWLRTSVGIPIEIRP